MDYPEQKGLGYLHVLRQGQLRVFIGPSLKMTVIAPAVIFFPRPLHHRFEVDPPTGAELVCSLVDFSAEQANPLFLGLPDGFHLSFEPEEKLGKTVEILFEEGFSDFPARNAAISRLMEYVLILLFRAAMEKKLVETGTIAGMADPLISKALSRIHEEPERPWVIEEMASLAGMSRARFAAKFRKVVGSPPLEYLTLYRISYVKTLLKKGLPLKSIAPTAGYSSQSTLTRVFSKVVGKPPLEWLSEVSNQKKKDS